MIEASLFPRRPSTFPSYGVELAGGGQDGTAPIGYLSLRPDERQDGVLSIALSLQPAYWGTPLEAQVVRGAVYLHAGGEPAQARVMISTTAHADRSQALFTSLGLARGLDDRPILFKDLQPDRA
jgi:RimJ/RimL family protein N-acetyltransferase